MFGPDKITLFLDKTAAIVGIGFIITACAFVMLKNGIERIINGDEHHTSSNSRLKGFLHIAIALAFLVCGITVILESEKVTDILTHQVKQRIQMKAPTKHK